MRQPALTVPRRTPSLAAGRLAWIMVGACVMGLGAGCRSSGAAAQAAHPFDVPKYKQVHLVYELNGRFRDIPVESDKITQASFDPEAQHRWSAAQLRIDYPHPDGSAESARATLRLSRRAREREFQEVFAATQSRFFDLPDLFRRDPAATAAPPSEDADDEVWVLDIPRQQLDLLLLDLAQGGFFESQNRTQPGTRLDIEIDKGRLGKTWSPEPRLDDFVSRVREEGCLSGFVACDCSHMESSEPETARKDGHHKRRARTPPPI